MGLLESLKCLLCCSPIQQQESDGLYQHQQPQYGYYTTTVQPPITPEPRPSHTQRIHEVLPAVPYQQQQPRYETEAHRISVQPPPKPQPRPSHTQRIHEVLPAVPYQQQQPRYEIESHRISVQPSPKARPRPSRTQSVGVRPPASDQLQQQQTRYESEPSLVVQPPSKLQQGPSRTQWVGRNPVDQENDSHRLLRDRAIEEGDAMAQSFQGSHEAHANGDRALAKRLSDKAKRHRAEMNRLNKEASELIFAKNNKNRQPGVVDLHGLYVQEAIAFTKRVVQETRTRGDPQISLIVGKGRHSSDGAKIKPAIEGLMKKSKLVARVDPSNAGKLIVRLEA